MLLSKLFEAQMSCFPSTRNGLNSLANGRGRCGGRWDRGGEGFASFQCRASGAVARAEMGVISIARAM